MIRIYKILEDLLKKSNVDYHKNHMLSNCCTFKIGGSVDYIVYPKDTETLIDVVNHLNESGIKYHVLGNASNVLFADEGYRGVVVFTSRLDNIRADNDIINVECGVPLTRAAVFAMKHGLTGLEFAYGIPGTCGGAIYMNAGAYGGEMKDVTAESVFYNGKTICKLTDHEFSYRKSFYTNSDNIILSAVLKLNREDPEVIKKKMDEYMACRIEKQPLDYPSAGSVFKRCPGHHTAKLIDEAGLKGFTVGGAQVSEKHAGFIINRGNATASDVLKLIEIIKNEIYKRNNIDIECEIKYVCT